jgi:enoyl-CoA hydratase/carnithine racemase
MRGYYSLFLCLRDLAVPIVASINGPAVGAGLAVALAADVRVASVSSYLGFPFAKLGIHPGMGSSLLLARVVGHERAAHMFLTGEFYSSAQAKEAGLVMEVVGAAAAEAATEAAQQESATETETKAAAGMAAADATFIRAMQIATSMARNRSVLVSMCISCNLPLFTV